MKDTKTCPECGVALITIVEVGENTTVSYGCPVCDKLYPEAEAEALNGGQP